MTLPAKVAQQVDRLAKRRRFSDNRVLVELIEDGIEAQQRKEKAFFELAERFRPPVMPPRPDDWATNSVFCLRGMNAADRDLVAVSPAAVRDHLAERMRDRKIGVADLNRLRIWIESRPIVPRQGRSGFGSFKLCGEGKYPKTFLQTGQVAMGERL